MRRSVLLWSLAGAVALWAVGWLGVLAETPWGITVENLGFLAVPLCAAVAAALTARDPRQGRARRSFLFLALGSLAWAAGQGAWTVSAATGDELPFPSVADVGYLAALPLFGMAVVLWPRRRRLRSGSLVFDATLAIGLTALLFFDLAIRPILQEGVHGVSGWFALAYPVADLLLATLVIAGAFLDGWADRGRLSLVGAALIGLAVADTIFAVDVGDGRLTALLDVTWILPFAALTAAALLPRGWPASLRRPIPTLALPIATTVLVGCVAAIHGVGELGEEGLQGLDAFALATLLILVSTRALLMARASAVYAAKLERTDADLRAAQAARNRFLVEVVNAQETEARRIADLLHDDVVQQLTALGFRLELAAQRHELPQLTELAREGSAITGAIRRLLVELHPVVLESQGLGPAIDVAAERLRERGVDVRVTPFPHRLPRELETLTYRIVQEALANVQRHSHALYAEVELRLADGVLRGRVRDTGAGFSLDEPSGGAIGLHVSRERVELVGGRFLVEASPGQGTSVVFELPLPGSDEATEAVS
jgi:signal transduction histidine kinase